MIVGPRVAIVDLTVIASLLAWAEAETSKIATCAKHKTFWLSGDYFRASNAFLNNLGQFLVAPKHNPVQFYKPKSAVDIRKP